MDHDEAEAAFAASLRQIAPAVDLDGIDPTRPLLDELELDATDFRTLITGLHARTGLTIPESDYPRLETLSDALGYLVDES